jgi:hypothetical protein
MKPSMDRTIFETEYITKTDSLSTDCIELLKLLVAITKKKLKESLN